MKIKDYKCPGCGAKVNKDQKVCPYCQTPLHFENEDKDLSSKVQDHVNTVFDNQKDISDTINNVLDMQYKISCVIRFIVSIVMIIGSLTYIIFSLTSNKALSMSFIILLGVITLLGIIIFITSIRKFVQYRKNKNKPKT